MSDKLKLSIPEMSCGHCKAAVEGAITGLDAGAQVAVDLDSRTAEVASSAAPEALVAALAEAGYAASPVS
ncbi:cation transporter [Acidimangrovimonas pyrenivorans]|uniref:Cation transporter n=1 Tax=Acidimangrovimonas pyrenivorans TaxID=2030798 RepID=A0ABV7AB18_9RHOB